MLSHAKKLYLSGMYTGGTAFFAPEGSRQAAKDQPIIANVSTPAGMERVRNNVPFALNTRIV